MRTFRNKNFNIFTIAAQFCFLLHPNYLRGVPSKNVNTHYGQKIGTKFNVEPVFLSPKFTSPARLTHEPMIHRSLSLQRESIKLFRNKSLSKKCKKKYLRQFLFRTISVIISYRLCLIVFTSSYTFL